MHRSKQHKTTLNESEIQSAVEAAAVIFKKVVLQRREAAKKAPEEGELHFFLHSSFLLRKCYNIKITTLVSHIGVKDRENVFFSVLGGWFLIIFQRLTCMLYIKMGVPIFFTRAIRLVARLFRRSMENFPGEVTE